MGDAVFLLNTSIVGLEAVEKGYQKSDGLDISWNPSDAPIAARKARKFVVESVLVRAFEALLEHMLLLEGLPRFKAENQLNRSERIERIYGGIVGDSYLVSAAVLTAHWRNRIVHPRSSKAKLEAKHKKILRDNECEIAKKYAKLSVDCLLCHFEENRPTLKDVSSLVSMAINLGREVDKNITQSLTVDDFHAWVKYAGVEGNILKVIRETKSEKVKASVRRVLNTNASFLADGIEEFWDDDFVKRLDPGRN